MATVGKHARAASLLLAGLLANCARRDGSSLEPPANLRIERDGTYTGLIVTWAPRPDVDGYEVEGRVGGGQWESLLATGELVPAAISAGFLRLAEDVPEQILIELRVRSVRGSSRSAWSAAALDTGLRWPEAVEAHAVLVDGAQGAHTGPVTINWTNASRLASEIQLERGTAAGGGPTGVGLPIEGVVLTPGRGVHVDGTVGEGSAFAYRIRVGTGGVWSDWSTASSETVDVVAPTNLTAVALPGGVQLAWKHLGSISALQVSREAPGRMPAVPLATLPAGTSGYFDPLPDVWPGTSYRVGASRADFTIPVFVAAPPATILAVDRSAPLALHGRLVRLPASPSIAVAAAANGLVHLATYPTESNGSLTAWRDTGTGWQEVPLPGGVIFARPGVRVDAIGNPHYVHYRGYPGLPTTALEHTWWDGSGWQHEDLPAPEIPNDDASFDVGGDGMLHVVHTTRFDPPSATTSAVVYLAGLPGAMTRAVVATRALTDTALVRPGQVEVGADGTGAIILGALEGGLWTTQVIARAPSGAFGTEPVPITAGDGEPRLAGVGSGGAVAVLQRRLERPAAIWRTTLSRRVSGAWIPEEEIEDIGPEDLRASSLSADGRRLILLLAAYPGPLTLRARTEAGWSTGVVGPSTPLVTGAGAWPDGRFHLEAIVGSFGECAAYAEPDATTAR